MRIVHVVRQFHPAIGGLEDAVLNLAMHQRAFGRIDVRVVTLDRLFSWPEQVMATNADVKGIPVRRISWRGSTRYPIAPSVLREIGDADLVHVHAIDFFFDYLAATSAIHRRPLVASTHGGFFHSGDFAGAKRVYFNTVTRLACRRYRAIIACSENDATLFAPVAAGRLATIENGVDVEKFEGASSPLPTRRMIYFGRFARHKNIEHLFQLVAALCQLRPGWELIVAGYGNDDDVRRLEAASRGAVPDGSVRIVQNPDDAEIAGLIGSATYYVCASSHEGFGLAAVEAMSAGLVPVLSAIPPFIKLLRQSGTGLLLDDASIEISAMRLSELHGDIALRLPEVRKSLSDAALAFGWTRPAAAYEALYDRVLCQRGASSGVAAAFTTGGQA